MKKVRFYTAFGLRIIGYILNLPSAVIYTISDIVKNEGDTFSF